MLPGKMLGLRGNPVARCSISDHPDNRFTVGKLREIFVSPTHAGAVSRGNLKKAPGHSAGSCLPVHDTKINSMVSLQRFCSSKDVLKNFILNLEWIRQKEIRSIEFYVHLVFSVYGTQLSAFL